MRTIIKYTLFILTGLLLFNSCEDYLEKTPYAEVSDEDVFNTYESFQGFIDRNYADIINPYNTAIAGSNDLGGSLYSNKRVVGSGNAGDYWDLMKSSRHRLHYIEAASNPSFEGTWGDINEKGYGYWFASWRGIRTCNLALEKLPLLTDATQEEKDLIKGQIHFFRAFFHHELMKFWGGMPYINKLFSPAEPMKEPRLTYQECTDKLVLDFDTAVSLLPENWDETVVGSARPGANTGRATKGAALAFKAKALLYAGSPLMNGSSGNSFTYNKSYMEKAAAAAWEVIKLANKGVYSLTPFDNYRDMFARNDVNSPYTDETIFLKIPWIYTGKNAMTVLHGRYFNPARFGGNGLCHTPNQNYLDRFEMADGTRYKLVYDNDNSKRWDFRDPRFKQNVIIDREKWGFNNKTVFELYEGGEDKGAGVGMYTAYCIKKYWPIGVNNYDKEWNDFKFVIPQMRLADVYLFYAEAVNEAYGATGTAPGASLTAVDAVNLVRNRAGMPPVTATPAGYSSFRELVWNERCVELCWEDSYWFDIRRWHVGHLPEYKPIVDLKFDKDWTNFERVVISERHFEDKHYWLPIPREQTQLYEGFGQNPGW